MSVLIETALGDFTIDLYIESAPLNSNNFLKLCKRKYFNGAIFNKVTRNYVAELTHIDSRETTYNKFFKKHPRQTRFLHQKRNQTKPKNVKKRSFMHK